jgi:hypothetical protein
MNEPVVFKIEKRDLEKYPELKEYYDAELSTVTTKMEVLLRQICKGKGMQVETQDTIYVCIK